MLLFVVDSGESNWILTDVTLGTFDLTSEIDPITMLARVTQCKTPLGSTWSSQYQGQPSYSISNIQVGYG